MKHHEITLINDPQSLFCASYCYYPVGISFRKDSEGLGKQCEVINLKQSGIKYCAQYVHVSWFI